MDRKHAGRRPANEFGPDVYARHIINTIKAQEKPYFAYFPMTLPHLPLVPTPLEKAGYKQMNEHEKWAAMMRYADHLIGQIVAAIDATPAAENTLIIVTSDNGTPRTVNGRCGWKERIH